MSKVPWEQIAAQRKKWYDQKVSLLLETMHALGGDYQLPDGSVDFARIPKEVAKLRRSHARYKKAANKRT